LISISCLNLESCPGPWPPQHSDQLRTLACPELGFRQQRKTLNYWLSHTHGYFILLNARLECSAWNYIPWRTVKNSLS
jgi:hypothetical protein